MAIGVLTDAKVFLGGKDLSGDSNAVASDYTVEIKDTTTLDQTFTTNAAGTKTFKANVEGYVNTATSDLALFNGVGVAGEIASIVIPPGTVGEIAFFAPILQSSLSTTKATGEVHNFSVSLDANGKATRGVLADHGTEVATGDGTGYQLGAVGATGSLMVAIHMFAIDQGTVTFDIESDDNSGFTTASAVAGTSAVTAVGSSTISYTGAITDDYFRVNWTFSGGATSATFAVVIGIFTP